MKYKFKIGDIVQYKTQKGFFEPYSVIAQGIIENEIDKQIFYNLQNSMGRHAQVCETLLKKYEWHVIK